MVGQTLGHYTILDEVGEGGMGVVYRAYDTVLQRVVAIKVPKDRRALQEARHASLLNHPNICTVHEVIEHEGRTLIVMEFVDGDPLFRLVRGHPLPVDALVRWATEIADALAHAHYRGVVHRDLKSANVLVTREQRIKVLDFGLAARILEQDPDAQTHEADLATDVATVGGTLAYMAPELLSGGMADARSDVWALGVLFFEMATGILPFRGRTAHEVSAAILDRRPALPPARLPRNLVAVIERCLMKHPEQRYQTAGEIRAALESRPSMRAQSTSIAVLPFTDLSAERDQEYFCEGMAEELINALTAIEDLAVASRTSAFQFKGQARDLIEIGKQLKVEAVLEGSVRTSGSRLRVTVQLVSVSNGFQLWSDRYDRDIGDVFVMQDEIAHAILDRLKVKLVGDADAVVKHQTHDLEAYHLYLRGRYYWARRYRGFIGKAVECFEQAIDRDPTYALAYAGLADGFTTLAIQGAVPPASAGAKAKVAAERAVALDDALAEAHTAMAFVRFFVDWNIAEAVNECRIAIDRNPSAGAPRGMLAAFLASRGRFDDALAEAAEAKQVEPVSPLVGYYVVFACLFAGEYERACDEGRALVELDPHLAQSFFVLAIGLSCTGRHDDAIAASDRALELSNRWSRALSNLGAVYAAAGRVEDARRMLEELDSQSKDRYVSPLDFAFVLAQLGDHDAACTWLERAYAEHHPLLMFIAVYPWLEPLRRLPRFHTLIRQMKL